MCKRDKRLGLIATIFQDCMATCDCPTCEVEAGEPCDGITTVHSARLDAYDELADIRARVQRAGERP